MKDWALNHPRLMIIILYGAAGFLIYSNVIINGEFLFDDFEYVVGNSLIHDFSSYLLNLSDPRQIGYLSFAFNYAIGGEEPTGFHLANLFIHIMNAILVFLLIELILTLIDGEENLKKWQRTVAFFTGFIFLVHPVETQAVSYITQRFTSLSALFYLLSVYLYLLARSKLERIPEDRKSYILYALSLFSAILAMKTKEIAFTLPFALLMFEILLFRNSLHCGRRFYYLIPYMASLIIIPLSIVGPDLGLINHGRGIAEVTRVEKMYDLHERPWSEYFFTQFRVVVTYMRLLFLPIGQRVVYNFKVSGSLLDIKVVASLLVIVFIIGYAIYSWRRSYTADPEESSGNKLVAIGIIWFFMTLSIESSVIPIKDLIFEHRVYLPSVGFIAACSVLLMRFIKKIRVNAPEIMKIGIPFIAISITLSVCTYVRNEIWTDEVLFWDDVVNKVPDKAIGYHNRGNAYAKVGKLDLALKDMTKTIGYFPKNPAQRLSYENADFTPTNMAKTFMNRGIVYMRLGFPQLAEEDFSRSKALISAPPLDVDQTLRTADMYLRGNLYDPAIHEYNRILQWDPQNIDALNNRGSAYYRSSRLKEAIADFDTVISLRPDNVLAYYNRGIVYTWSGNTQKALEDFNIACGSGFAPACSSIELVAKGK